jgi:hypothetical protein
MKDSLENDWSLERVDAEADVDALNMNRRIRNLGRKTEKKKQTGCQSEKVRVESKSGAGPGWTKNSESLGWNGFRAGGGIAAPFPSVRYSSLRMIW